MKVIKESYILRLSAFKESSFNKTQSYIEVFKKLSAFVHNQLVYLIKNSGVRTVRYSILAK